VVGNQNQNALVGELLFESSSERVADFMFREKLTGGGNCVSLEHRSPIDNQKLIVKLAKGAKRNSKKLSVLRVPGGLVKRR
jgi:hypothetical protein